MIAASLSYYAMLAIFPALIAAISIYALILAGDRKRCNPVSPGYDPLRHQAQVRPAGSAIGLAR